MNTELTKRIIDAYTAALDGRDPNSDDDDDFIDFFEVLFAIEAAVPEASLVEIGDAIPDLPPRLLPPDNWPTWTS